MKNFAALVRSGIAFFLLVIFTLAIVTPASSQTAVDKVGITAINHDDFPEVRVQVKPLDANGAFIPGLDEDQFSLTEDGEAVQIEEVRTAPLPHSMRVAFVIDEFVIEQQVQVAREAIQSFAENQMQAGDFVEVLAASDGGVTQIIVPLTDNPEEVVNKIQSYNPASADGTLLLDTIDQGLAELSALNENIEGLNRMVVFSISINDSRNLDETIEKAVQLGIPVHTVLLGSEDAKGALGRLAVATQAGGGIISPEDINDLFETLEAERVQNQYEVSYRSIADQAGGHELVVAVDGVSSNAVSFTLDQLESPIVSITVPASKSLITRTETSFDQDPATIQPTEQSVRAEITWPDGHPRKIVKTALVVNGKSLDASTVILDNEKDPVILEITWDLSEENTPGETPISIIVEVEDELGLKGSSEPLPVTVNYVLFTAPNNCPSLISDNFPALCSNYNLIIPLGSAVIAISAVLAMFVYMRRNPRVQERVKERLETMMANRRPTRTDRSPASSTLVEPSESAKATLEVLGGNSGNSQTVFRLNGTTTLGRSGDYAQLVFQSDQADRSPISRLHCTIVEKGDFFEVRDEGSSNGTFLNGARIRSGELHRLSNGDTVELARVEDGGVRLKFQSVSRSSHLETRLVVPEKEDSDDLPKDGYTPTKVM
jgi:pSer/pThr/pTyr-binding forkhead associated (FHA) protein